jgi:hypothetical protein
LAYFPAVGNVKGHKNSFPEVFTRLDDFEMKEEFPRFSKTKLAVVFEALSLVGTIAEQWPVIRAA